MPRLQMSGCRVRGASGTPVISVIHGVLIIPVILAFFLGLLSPLVSSQISFECDQDEVWEVRMARGGGGIFRYVAHYECRGGAPLETFYIEYGESVHIQRRFLPIRYSFVNSFPSGHVREYLTSLVNATIPKYYTVSCSKLPELPLYLRSLHTETENSGFPLVMESSHSSS